MSFRYAGIIEGFYGPPWSFDDRLRAVRFLGEHGGNTYVYAPKNDPLHRDRWREPYLPEEWERFAGLREAAERAGVTVWFGISPLRMRVTDDTDVDLLAAKVAAADAAGFHQLCLLVDDMPEDFSSSDDAARFGSLAAVHTRMVELVRETQQRLGPGRELWFVPLHYHGDPDDAYVRAIGELVPPDVAIMWTGPEVCSEQITRSHLDAVAASLRRPVLLWDNHPVNDGGMQYDPHLGPLRGRDPDLDGAASGILSNAAIQPEASLVAVRTFLAYARDPRGYDPSAAWRDALAVVAGDAEDARAVATLAELSPRSPLARGEPAYPSLEPLERFAARWRSEPAARREVLGELEQALRTLRDVAVRLTESLANERLRGELAPWSRKLRLQVEAASTAAAHLSAALDGRAHPVARERVLGLLDEARGTFHRVADNRVEVLARECLRLVDEPAVQSAGQPAGPEPAG